MCNVSKIITKLLLIVGALNWGLIGFFQYDLIGQVFGGDDSTGARILFALVGLAGLCAVFCLARSCCCGDSCHCDCGCKTCCKDKKK